MKTALAFSALLLVYGCSHKVDTVGAPTFGASVETLHNAQALPETVSETEPEGSGAQGALAQKRYETGQTRPLLPTNTSSANPSTN